MLGVWTTPNPHNNTVALCDTDTSDSDSIKPGDGHSERDRGKPTSGGAGGCSITWGRVRKLRGGEGVRNTSPVGYIDFPPRRREACRQIQRFLTQPS